MTVHDSTLRMGLEFGFGLLEIVLVGAGLGSVLWLWMAGPFEVLSTVRYEFYPLTH